jgi:hypothetical protein
MKNLNQKIFTTLALSNKKSIINDIPMSHINHCIFATNLYYDINNIALVKRLQTFQCKKLLIFDIVPFGKENTSLIYDHNNSLPISKYNPYFINHTVTLKNFFAKEYLNSLIYDKKEKFNNEPIINNSIFVFHIIPLPLLNTCFKLNKFLLVGGSNSRRHMLSIVQHRLSQFLSACEGMGKSTIFDSFHNYDRLGVQPLFNHSILDRVESLKDISKFFIELEKYVKIKLNVNLNSEDFT